MELLLRIPVLFGPEYVSAKELTVTTSGGPVYFCWNNWRELKAVAEEKTHGKTPDESQFCPLTRHVAPFILFLSFSALQKSPFMLKH